MDAALEWGLPDWQDPAAYGDTGKWSLGRWRWEFHRRREDLRAWFDDLADDQYREGVASQEILKKQESECYIEFTRIYSGETVRPDQRGFTVPDSIEYTFGYTRGIPNPRISDQPELILGTAMARDDAIYFSYKNNDSVFGKKIIEMEAGKNEIVVRFDLDRPLLGQLERAEKLLKKFQRERIGKIIQKRKHKDKWLLYLRALDGRECGASWSEIAAILPPTMARTEQAARDVWEAASALRFNF